MKNYNIVKAEMQVHKEKVCALLKWDEQQYGNFMYKQGCAYLQHYIPNDPDGIDQLIRSNVYWAWWRNHWLLRDKQFCINGVHQISEKHKLYLYQELHNAESLAKEIRLDKVVLDLSYANMINQFIKEEVL